MIKIKYLKSNNIIVLIVNPIFLRIIAIERKNGDSRAGQPKRRPSVRTPENRPDA